MRAITHCPACQTEFFVNETQLAQHQGKVRCGECLHVFDATEQLIPSPADEASIKLVVEPSASKNKASFSFASSNTSLEDQPYNADESALAPSAPAKGSRLVAILLASSLGLVVIAQASYFLRNDIALYYPKLKPILVQACVPLACSIELPKKIDLIVIDDSNLQEDETHTGLIHLSSTLINQATFNQAYPNLEVTLTDTEDKPQLRRIFKPTEYLPADSNLSAGITAKEPLKIELAISTADVAVAGYRVAVSY